MYSQYSKIKFKNKKDYQALGRNGYTKEIGISFWAYEAEIRRPLRIFPINSKNKQTVGFIEIPLDELTPFINELIKQKNMYLEWRKKIDK